MRELKFRAWDKYHNRMLPSESLAIFFKAISNKGQWDIMQYAGRKDNNNVEVYESDVITNTVIRKQFIIPKKGKAYYRNMPITTRCIVSWDNHWGKWNFTNEVEIGVIKIIGNIYQKS